MKQALILCLLATAAQARLVDTTVPSPSMPRTVEVQFVEPSRTAPEAAIYLLHGYGGDHHSWAIIRDDLELLADHMNLLFVCPNAETSWYWDLPTDSTVRFETFVATELTDHVRATYGIGPRAITGFSMGAQGALWLSLRHPDVFPMCGAISPCTDPRDFPANWSLANNLGPLADNPDRWEQHSLKHLVTTVSSVTIITIDCGYSDFFHPQVEAFHEQLLALGIAHEYDQRPGSHTIEYAAEALAHQLLFFSLHTPCDASPF